jgi:hypothetical protein
METKIKTNKDGSISLRCSPEEYVWIKGAINTIQYMERNLIFNLPYWDQDAEDIKSLVKEEYSKKFKEVCYHSDMVEQMRFYEWLESHPTKSQSIVLNDTREK